MQVSLRMDLGEARGQAPPAGVKLKAVSVVAGAGGSRSAGLGIPERASGISSGTARHRDATPAGGSIVHLASAGTATGAAANSMGFPPHAHAQSYGPVESISVPFVVVKAQSNLAQNTTTIEVQVSAPSHIVSAYLLLHGPVAMAAAAFLYLGSPDWLYRVLLPFALCTMSIGVLLVDQSLAALMGAPIAITSVQSAFLCLLAGAWGLCAEINRPSLGRHLLLPMAMWAGVAAMYAAHEMLSHLVSYQSSLCERMLFMSLCPVLSHLVEEAVEFPGGGKTPAPYQPRVAIATIFLGAVLFSTQVPDVTFAGLAWVCLLMAQAVPFRLLERWMLTRWRDLPTPALACYDAAYLFATSAGVSASQQDHFGETWQHWTSNSSILCMLVLSLVVFSGRHLCELALLRETSATCVLVYSSIANVAAAALVVVFFGERAWSSLCAIVGILVSLAGCIWYAFETAQGRDAPAEALPDAGSPSAKAPGASPRPDAGLPLES